MERYLKIIAVILQEIKKENPSSKEERDLCKCICENWLDDAGVEPQHLFNKEWLLYEWIPENKNGIQE